MMPNSNRLRRYSPPSPSNPGKPPLLYISSSPSGSPIGSTAVNLPGGTNGNHSGNHSNTSFSYFESTDDDHPAPDLPRHPYQRVLNIICGYTPAKLQQPHRRYNEFVIIGRETWRPSATLLTERVHRKSWDSFLTDRLLRSTTTWAQWEKDFQKLYSTAPQMRECFLTHGWDDTAKLPHHLSPSVRSLRTIKSVLHSWYPSLDNQVTIVFQYAPPAISTTITRNRHLHHPSRQHSSEPTVRPNSFAEDNYTETEPDIELFTIQEMFSLPENYTHKDSDNTPERTAAENFLKQTIAKHGLTALDGYEAGIPPDYKRRRIGSTEL
ncbi:uncharacterized protein LAJ45_11576 [Morchella importuna]|uniref:uncharacterized protein n=1 Tax=Morchella importuna TaxID=1174673 RepID=UPI001E8D0CD7|nr:uncharacterized protein LAJ45_11576 [Morchella importuna]KAH8144446.1 hypothetical protein LAJ45_11576 [Morchella importuna]